MASKDGRPQRAEFRTGLSRGCADSMGFGRRSRLRRERRASALANEPPRVVAPLPDFFAPHFSPGTARTHPCAFPAVPGEGYRAARASTLLLADGCGRSQQASRAVLSLSGTGARPGTPLDHTPCQRGRNLGGRHVRQAIVLRVRGADSFVQPTNDPQATTHSARKRRKG